MATFHAKRCTITIEDGAALSQSTGPGAGTIEIPDLEEDNREVFELRDRTNHYAIIPGNERNHDFTIELILKNESLTDGSAFRVLDAVRKTGTWAAATSKETTDPEVWACQIVVSLSDGTNSASITMAKCRVRGTISIQAETGTLTINGTCYGEPTLA